MTYGTSIERETLKRRGGFRLLTSIVCAFASPLVPTFSGPPWSGTNALYSALAVALLGLSLAFWILGCGYLARSRGWSSLFGLLGLLTVPGLVIVLLLPDRWKRALASASLSDGPASLTNYPR